MPHEGQEVATVTVQSWTRGLPVTPEICQQFIETRILTGEWPAGSKLPSERVLAENLGVSRPVVREILKKLQANGLIDVLPGKGSYVMDLRPTAGYASIDHLVRGGQITTRDLITARRMLESEAASLAAVHRRDEEIAHMRRLLSAFDAAGTVQEAVELDTAFHESIVVSSGNAVIQIMFASIRKLVQAMILRSLTDRRTRQLGAPIHHTILDAIEARDPHLARREMLAHITLSEERYGADLDLPLADVLNQRATANLEHAALFRGLSASIREIQ